MPGQVPGGTTYPAGTRQKEHEMNLFWLNALPIAAAVAAWAGIPLWMVARHPNWSSVPRRRLTATLSWTPSWTGPRPSG